jgi:hypothetical protein
MHKANVITLTIVMSAGALGMAVPAMADDSAPIPDRLFIECPGGYTDLGDGQGNPMCVPTDSQFCPGSWTDSNGDGDVAYDYGECYYTGGELYPGGPPGGGAPTNPPTLPVTTPPPPPPTSPPATQPPPTQPPPTQAPATQAPATQASATQPQPTQSPATQPPATTEPLPLSDPTITITAAEVACDGMIRVEYETAANPAPADDVSHLILFNPISNPIDFHVTEFTSRDPHGTYTFEELGSAEDSYRVFVTIVFDPDDPDEVALTDWADATVVDGC